MVEYDKKIRRDWENFMKELELRLQKLQVAIKPKTSLRMKITSTLAGLTLIGSGGTTVTSVVIDSLIKYNALTTFGAVQSFIGTVLGIFGYMLAHKGLEGTWL